MLSESVLSGLLTLAGTILTVAVVPFLRWLYIVIRDHRRSKRLLAEAKALTIETVDDLKATIQDKNRELDAFAVRLAESQAQAAYWNEESRRWQQASQEWRSEAEASRRVIREMKA